MSGNQMGLRRYSIAGLLPKEVSETAAALHFVFAANILLAYNTRNLHIMQHE
jgi:hypothetical protein